MTKAVVLYVVTLSLHTALIAVVLQFRVDKRHPIFFLLLATSLFSNLALLALRLAQESAAYARLAERMDWMWYGLAGLALAWAVAEKAKWITAFAGMTFKAGDAASGAVICGLVMMIVMALVARYGAKLPLAGCLGPRAASALNLAYLAPTVYLICALSNVGVDLLRISNQLSVFSRQWQTAAGWARAFFA